MYYFKLIHLTDVSLLIGQESIVYSFVSVYMNFYNVIHTYVLFIFRAKMAYHYKIGINTNNDLYTIGGNTQL